MPAAPRLSAALRRIVPGEGVIDAEYERRAFECDGLTAYRQLPMVVVLPEATAQVVEVLRYCSANNVKVVPRGAGTSLSGGALPLEDGVLLGLGKFNRILEIDIANRCVVVQPGVTNLGITHAVQAHGLYYAPDPSSQIACTIGGNVAENSGGVHCLKYGLTTNNVIGVEMVTMEGEVVRLGGKHFDASGYDLLGVMVGSEGMLGVVTEVTVRVLPTPPGARALMIGFPSVEGAGDCVAAVIGGGIIPGGMEIMDRLAIEAAEAFVHAGYPLDAEALLIVELDGCEAEVDHLIAAVEAIAARHGATSCRTSRSEEERLLFWAGRKAAFPAVGRISPDYYCMDGTIPRKRIGDVLAAHEADGSALRPARRERVPRRRRQSSSADPLRRQQAWANSSARRRSAADILRLCVEVGGVLTGEHGVGVEKRDLMDTMFNEIDLNQQQRLKCAFDRKEPAQSRESVPAALPLRRTRPRACPRRTAALPRSAALLNQRSFMTVFQPSNAAEAAEVVAWARRGRSAARDRRRREQARARSSSTRRSSARRAAIGRNRRLRAEPNSFSPRAPRRRWPRSRLSLRQSGRCWPSSRRIGAASSAATASRRSAAFSPAISPGRGGCGPGPRAIISSAFRRSTAGAKHSEGRRQGGEERHRLRHVQAAGRRLWHACRCLPK